MKRGINHKRINFTLDSETIALLNKYKGWGTSYSAHVRRAVKAYEKQVKYKAEHSDPYSQDAEEETWFEA